jgi:hypothetical protein
VARSARSGVSAVPNSNTFAASPDGMKSGSLLTDQLTSLVDSLLAAYDRSKQYPANPTFGDPKDPVVQAVLKQYVPTRDGIEAGLEGTIGALSKSGNMVLFSANDFQSQQDLNLSNINKSSRP